MDLNLFSDESITKVWRSECAMKSTVIVQSWSIESTRVISELVSLLLLVGPKFPRRLHGCDPLLVLFKLLPQLSILYNNNQHNNTQT